MSNNVFKDKNCFINGATGGIGEYIASELANKDINLFLTSTNSMKNSTVINVTRLNSERAFPLNPAYMSSKGALKQLTKSFALDYGNYAIWAYNLGPGYFKTNMTKKAGLIR